VLPNRFSLVLPDANHVELLRAALWWNRRRLWAALASVCGLAGLAGVFAFSVGRKNRALKREITRREAAENRLFSERVRMASDLHDNLEQTLLATSLQLNAATRTVDQNPQAAMNRLALAGQLLARGRKEVKEAVWDLQFGGTQKQQLSDILKKECAEASAVSATEVCCLVSEDEPLLPASFLTQVLRIVRESLTNAFKHAAATQIQVAAVFDDGALKVTVVDNGRGFDPQSAPGPDSGHFGLSNMVERAKKLGGTLEILRMQGGGTSVCARIPIPE
jgi:signal transduction histidine kinase